MECCLGQHRHYFFKGIKNFPRSLYQSRTEEQMLKRSIFAILTGLPLSHFPYIIDHDERSSCFMQLYNEWLHTFLLSRNLVTFSDHHVHPNWNQTVQGSSVKDHTSVNQIGSQVSWHMAMLNVDFIKSRQQSFLPWILLVQNKFSMSLKDPTGCGKMPNFIQINS